MKSQTKILKASSSYPLPHWWLLIPEEKNTFNNIVGKREYGGTQHFLLFPQWFISYFMFWVTFNLQFAASNMDKAKPFSFGKGLRIKETGQKTECLKWETFQMQDKKILLLN